MLQLDLVQKKSKNWYEEGAVPSEPFFVGRPGAIEEDDGEFISVESVYNVYTTVINISQNAYIYN